MSEALRVDARVEERASLTKLVLADVRIAKLRSDITRGSEGGGDTLPLPRLAQVRMWRWYVQTDLETARSLSRDLGLPPDTIIMMNRERDEARGAKEGREDAHRLEYDRMRAREQRDAALALYEAVGALALRAMPRSSYETCFWQEIGGEDWSPPAGRVRSSVLDDIARVVEDVPRRDPIKILFVKYAETRYFLAD